MEEIESAIYVQHHKPASLYFSKYGKSLFYISYPKNKNTTWYIFSGFTPMIPASLNISLIIM